MKRIAASVGLVAISTSALQAQDAGAISAMQGAKPWNASVSLRGFYDDNINSERHGKDDSFGFEINPTIGLALVGERTSGSLSYSYSGKWYDERPEGNSSNWDHTHIFNASVQHAFSSRTRLVVGDQFVIGQEPDVLRVNDVVVGPQRISGENIRNFGSIILTHQFTDLFGIEAGYANSYYNYEDSSPDREVGANGTIITQASRSGLLDRIEHYAHIDTRWHFAPQTVGIVGYMYGTTLYTADETIQGNPDAIPPIPYAKSDSRNNRSHFGYVGVEHSFSPDLSGSARVGAQYVDFYNGNDSSVTPYFMGTLRYFYTADSRVEVGASYQRNATDFVGNTSVVTDADTAVVYASVRHRIMPRLYGSAVGTFQWQRFNGGGAGADDESDRYFLLGLDAEYRFSPHWSGHVGYNLDVLDSDIETRNYTRNRVYIGVTADY
jgi:hypothetical protein